MDALALVVAIALAAVVAVAVARRFAQRVTVLEYERGLRYVKGAFRDLLSPGQYWIWRPTTSVLKVDVRPAFVSVPGQEVLTADGIALRLSLAAEYELADPVTAVNRVEDYRQTLYLSVQIALREVVGRTPIEELLERRQELGAAAAEIARPRVEEHGIRLRALDIKDVMFPGSLKRVFAQVVEAREEGRAALEKARGETAALRNLANAARLVEASPALMQLRILQQVAGSQGNTVVLGLPSTTTPLPLREGEPGPPPSELTAPDDESR